MSPGMMPAMEEQTGQHPAVSAMELAATGNPVCRIVERTADGVGEDASRKHSLSGADAIVAAPVVKRK